MPVSNSEPALAGASAGRGADTGLAPSPGRVGLVQILQTPLSVDDVLASVGDARAGGQVVFVGTVRDHDDGRSVTRLDYTAHPSAAAELRAVVQEAAARPGVVLASAVHRVGDLAIGDLAVVAACSAAHRAEAFEACAQLIEDLKHRVPIWKEQRFADGSSEWVAGL